MNVTALLVTHDGARWLPVVLEGIAAQSRPPDRLVAVDTGSRDDTPALLRSSPVPLRLVTAPESTPYGAAVREGLAALPPAADDEWVWLLHDDSTPAHDALEQLLAVAEATGADLLGPKLREWPSLRRLLEVGVTVSGTGRRETGLERGEYDQGQHDEVRTVLAVNTAGMLVRRRVLEELGLDAALPVFGGDLDLGWRAARAGHRTVVAPQAVVFHAEAAHRGLRRTALTGRHPHYQERRAALWTLLANSEGSRLPLRAVRLLLSSLLRALGLLLVRAPGRALDELAAVAAVHGRPGRLLAARRARAAGGGDPARVRPLLAPWWLPYRHGLDAVTDFVTALTSQAQDVAERRRAAAVAADRGTRHHSARPLGGHGDGGEPGDELADSGWLVGILTNPVALGLALFLVAVAVGTRDAWGEVSGGALPPAPAGAGDWWRLYAEHWHVLELGTDVPAPAYLPVLAAVATLLGGSAQGAVTALLVLALPLAGWGAWRLLRVAGHLADPLGAPRWLLGWGAASYALVPATSGAWGGGRYGLVAAAALLPWLAHAALGLADPDPDRRWRAGWRSALLLALVTAFAPAAWPFALLLGVVLLGAGTAIAPSAVRRASVWGPPLAALLGSVALLVPWWLPLLLKGYGGGLLLDPGRLPVAAPDGLDLLVGRLGEHAAGFLPGLVVVLLGVVALVPSATRVPALVCWLVGLVAALAALLLSWVALPVGGGTIRPGTALLGVVLQGAVVAAVVLAGTAPARSLVRGALPRVAGTVAAAALLLVPAAGLAWFAVLADDALAPTGDQGVPAYMEQSAGLGPAHGILVLSGSLEEGLEYTVRRDDGPTVGEPEVVALTEPSDRLTRTVGTLLSRPTTRVVDELAALGLEYVVLAGPADPQVATVLDTAPDLEQAGTEDRTMRAWRVDRPLDDRALRGPGSSLRTLLLVLQGVALVVVLVLCAPSRRSEP